MGDVRALPFAEQPANRAPSASANTPCRPCIHGVTGAKQQAYAGACCLALACTAMAQHSPDSC